MNFVKIKDYPYVIHPCGTILRIWKDMTKEIKPYKLKNGYMQVGLCKDKKINHFFHHRLLAIPFIPKENLNAFRSDRGVYAEITKGGICKMKNDWIWQYYMSGKKKSKYMKSKTDLEKFRKDKLAEYNIHVDV